MTCQKAEAPATSSTKRGGANPTSGCSNGHCPDGCWKGIVGDSAFVVLASSDAHGEIVGHVLEPTLAVVAHQREYEDEQHRAVTECVEDWEVDVVLHGAYQRGNVRENLQPASVDCAAQSSCSAVDEPLLL